MWNFKEFESIYSHYESSGLKVSDFCANEVINEAKFYYWQKKLRESKLPIQSFVPIVVDSKSPSSVVASCDKQPEAKVEVMFNHAPILASLILN